MNEAFLRELVPSHLHGRTQWKTLGARLSEDILHLRESSRFYRAHPGRFLLRELLADDTIPSEHRQPIIAKRRQRELKRKDVVCIPKSLLRGITRGNDTIPVETMSLVLHMPGIIYETNFDDVIESCLPLISFVVVVKQNRVLSYRMGKYRESRDSFQEKRSIGFTVPVSRYDNSLFDHTDHGAVRAGLAAIAADLDLRFVDMPRPSEFSSGLISYLAINEGMPSDAVLALIVFQAPDGFQPFTKRLAINDLDWIDARLNRNDLDDFDPWSKRIIESGWGLHLGNQDWRADEFLASKRSAIS